MNQPKVQTDVPAEGASPDANPTGDTPHGIPKGVAENDPRGRASDERLDSETAPLKTGGG